jgi:hypothetical protein
MRIPCTPWYAWTGHSGGRGDAGRRELRALLLPSRRSVLIQTRPKHKCVPNFIPPTHDPRGTLAAFVPNFMDCEHLPFRATVQVGVFRTLLWRNSASSRYRCSRPAQVRNAAVSLERPAHAGRFLHPLCRSRLTVTVTIRVFRARYGCYADPSFQQPSVMISSSLPYLATTSFLAKTSCTDRAR